MATVTVELDLWSVDQETADRCLQMNLAQHVRFAKKLEEQFNMHEKDAINQMRKMGEPLTSRQREALDQMEIKVNTAWACYYKRVGE